MEITNLPHHTQLEVCKNRPPYRQGRKFTSVKVYTVNDESIHLFLYNVPAIHLHEEVCKLCVRYGSIVLCTPVIGISSQQEFTETFHVQYEKIQNARFAKRQLDGKSFFGSILHVCYAPELETLEQTRSKLSFRRREIAIRINTNSSKDNKPVHKKPRLIQKPKKRSINGSEHSCYPSTNRC
uniref:RNA-binding protein 48 n=1 Tax=Clastoptera arizonana TaxID=38151 RepID=A0A1B6DN49_9HEMI